MSNPRGKQVASDLRGAWVRAARQLEEEGRPLSTLWREAIEKDFLAATRALAQFVPNEMLLNTTDEEGNEQPFTLQILPVASASSDT